jgi:serine/threonine-protein kinase
MIGQILANRYEILAKVGEGGMAQVYEARDNLLFRPVAIKILREQYASDTEFVERFRREAQAAASLSHPNVVNIYDVGQEQGVHYIVMEYVSGRNLKELIREQGPLPVKTAVSIAQGIAQALDHAHRHGLVHRDIKPHNILITEDGQVKVTDFGIARAASSVTLTQTGIVIGSVHYFSPEQARGQNVEPQSDLYSLGVVLYEMVSGRLPFTGESPISIAMQQIHEQATPLRKINPRVPASLEKVVAKAMAKDPKDRYQSAAEILADLRRIVPTLKEEVDEATQIIPQLDQFEETAVHTVQGGGEVSAKRTKRGWLYVTLFFIFFLAGVFWAAQRLPALIFPEEVAVPNLVGLNVEEAAEILAARDLRLDVDKRVFDDEIPVNHIVSQNPPANRQVKKHRTIYVAVSRGPELVTIPNVIGLSLREARVALGRVGLTVGEVSQEPHPMIPTGQVVGQEPAPGQRLTTGVKVDLVVSQGPEPAPSLIMPDLRGLPIEQAVQDLEVLGLKVRNTWPEISSKAYGIILDQNPPANTEVIRGEEVDLVYSSGPTGKPPAEAPPTDQQATVDWTPEGGTNLRRADVRISIPPGPQREVVILVIDERGIQEVYRQQHPGGDTFTVRVEGKGKQVKVQVYIGGEMYKEAVI